MRGRDVDWAITPDTDGAYTWDQIHTLVLMDIRQELRNLNARLSCTNLIRMQRTLDRISAHAARIPKRRKTSP